MAVTIYWIIFAILLFEFTLSRLLDYLNSQNWSQKLPSELQGIYDSEKYQKSQLYYFANLKFELFSSSFSFALILIMLFFDGFRFFDQVANSLSDNEILVSLYFFGLIFFISNILNIPFELYDTFVIEQKFGFNKSTIKIYILDKFKSLLLTIIIGGGILVLILWFYNLTRENFWIYTWLIVSLFMIFMIMFYSNLIVPLFNKQKPLDDGELKEEIIKFANKSGFRLNNIYVIDGSKRSTKANAYFTGLGPKKRIVLYDTLINDLSIGEIVAVLAHEIGHYKLKHSLVSIITSIFQTGITLYLMSLFLAIPDFSYALSVDKPSFHIGLISFGMLFSPISMFVGIFMNFISRKNEYQADRYAAQNSSSENLINALKKLSVNNLSNLNPHQLHVFINYSHPTLLQRIRAFKN